MVKKVKPLETITDMANDNQLAANIKDSAAQIWLAGLGAFSKAQEEGMKVFDTLVKEGSTLQSRTRSFAEGKLGEVTGRVSKAAGDVAKQATQSWDRLESVFEERVARALSRLGVPTSQEVKDLVARIDALDASVRSLSGKASRTAARAKAAREVPKAADRATRAKVKAAAKTTRATGSAKSARKSA